MGFKRHGKRSFVKEIRFSYSRIVDYKIDKKNFDSTEQESFGTSNKVGTK